MQNINGYYINVFRDEKGQMQHSECGLMNSVNKSLDEAINYVLNFNWTYVDTLSNYSHRVDFSEEIKDAVWERDHPDYECSRQQYEEMWRKNLADLTGMRYYPESLRATKPCPLITRGDL